jgi:hypothetical protein
MTRTEIIRTGPYMTHRALVDGDRIVRLACTNRVPKSAKVTDDRHVVCNKCSGATR